MALDQKNRLLKLATPLGENVLLPTAFRGHEEMSRLFHYELELLSDNAAISARSLVGKNVTFSVELQDGSPRFFNGFVSRLYAGDQSTDERKRTRREYRVEVVPWLWFLTLRSDCRIFQKMTVTDILQKVFSDAGFSDFDMSGIAANHPTYEYCVQYRESDFNFVSRLMEQEGIFYFFRHDNGKHTLVMADQGRRLQGLHAGPGGLSRRYRQQGYEGSHHVVGAPLRIPHWQMGAD
jgi:type VI secretion system secreted protein VgrG